MIDWAISLGEVKKKIKVSILESLDKGVRKLANLGNNFTRILISVIHEPKKSIYRREG